MTDQLDLHRKGLREFARRVHAVGPDQWTAATPCPDWDVRALVNHVAAEQAWVPLLLAGRTVGEVGDQFDGDVLGDDPVAAWDRLAGGSAEAFAGNGALSRTVHLSRGDTRAADYLWEMITDLTVHAWDLARAIGADDDLNPELVDAVLGFAGGHAAEWSGSDLFGEPVPVPDDAREQDRLVALLGRTP